MKDYYLEKDLAISHDGVSFTLVRIRGKRKDKQGNSVDDREPLGYFVSLESLLKAYANMAIRESNLDLIGAIADTHSRLESIRYEIADFFRRGEARAPTDTDADW